jgi:predicted nucleic acid-binding protein
MLVVADTSPINYLVPIAHIDLLARLYARIVIPPAALAELKHPLAPKPVRDWADNAPQWLEILSPKSSLILSKLDVGELRRSRSQPRCLPT